MNPDDTHSSSPQTFAGRVLSRISDDHLSPRPKWTFMLRNGLFWALGAFSILLGAFAFSAALFEVENVDWRLFAATHSDFFSFLIAAAPFLWLVVLLIFTLLGYSNIRHTKRGYRYPLAFIVLGAVLTSITLGTTLYSVGLGELIEEGLGDHPPFYRPIMQAQHEWWSHPEAGALGGNIVSAQPNLSLFVLRDFKGMIWTVNGGDLRGGDLTAVARGGIVRVVGIPTTATSTLFHACFVFPWEMHGGPFLPPPLPLALISSTSEINPAMERSQECRGIRPYQVLRSIER